MTPKNISTPFSWNSEGPIYMCAKRSPKDCNVAMFGVPYDGTTSFRPGTRFGPYSIKEVSNGLETFCPQLKIDLSDVSFADLGSIEINHGAPEPVINSVRLATNELLDMGMSPLMLGGEHSLTSGCVESFAKHYPSLILLQLDAHADLREEWLGSSHSHACSMRRCLDVLPSKKLFQLGIRSGTKEEFEEMETQNRFIPQTIGQPAKGLKKALMPYLSQPIYLTVDLDWFDPSIMPGTGTPEPGGFFWQDFAELVEILRHHNVVGADIVELAPQLDISGSSSILAAKVTRSLIMLLHLNKFIKK